VGAPDPGECIYVVVCCRPPPPHTHTDKTVAKES
jgi:hypothetical protein